MGQWVLLIEDHPGDTDLIEIALGDGFQVTHAWTVAEALAILARATPDLIIADLSFPDARQEEVLAALDPWRDRVRIYAKIREEYPIPDGWAWASKVSYPECVPVIRSLLAQ